MKRLQLLSSALLIVFALQPVRASYGQTGDGYAFVHVNVLPMDSDEVLTDRTVLVRGDRIHRIGRSDEIELPSTYTVIDGAGKYLMPGLAEMHGHVPDARGNATSVEETLFLYAANGITTVRGMLGWPGQLELRERALNGELVSPTLYLAGPSFNGNTVSSPEQAAARVREQKKEGWDLLKIHPGLTRAEYDAIAETANEIGIRFGGHVPADVGIRHALKMGQETFDHLDGFVEGLDGTAGPIVPKELDDLIDQVIEQGAWAVPTMVLWESLYGMHEPQVLASFEELRYVSPAQRRSWQNNYRSRLTSPNFNAESSALVIENRMMILRQLNRRGARILMGTDAPQLYSVPGYSLHREVKRMIEAGMSTHDVLRSGTVNVGEYFSNEDTFGLVKEGHRADLVLLEENPLEKIENLATRVGVMVRGRWLSKEYIDGKLLEIEKRMIGG